MERKDLTCVADSDLVMMQARRRNRMQRSLELAMDWMMKALKVP